MNLLHNVRVLDLSRVISGPFSTRMLADLGAEVLKIESPDGELMRQSPPFKGEFNSFFTQFNAGKKSVCIDLRAAEGVALVKRLVPACDVLVENFRAGRLAEIGLGYEVLEALNPRIICCSISGFGQQGPDAGRPAYTDIIQALAGYDYAAQNIREYEGDGPPGVPVSLADSCASLNATIAILAALYHRELTGEGQHLDVSMYDSLVASNDSTLQRCIFSDGEDGIPSIIFRPPLKAADGCLAASISLSFEKVVHVIGAPELLEDERFTGPVGRREHMGVFVDLVRAWVSERTLAEVTDLFEANDIPYGKVQSSQEVVTSPIMREREMLVDLDLPGAGLVPVLNTPFRSSRGKSRPQGPPPQLGQHTRDVLGELLGLGAAELDSLIEQGIIHTADRT